MMFKTIEDSLRTAGYKSPVIHATIAGGIAVNYWCGARLTRDVDVEFSARVALPNRLAVAYSRADGREHYLYFDYNHTTRFSLLHPDSNKDAVPHTGLNLHTDGQKPVIELRVLTPDDLAVSKLARYSEQDRSDIRALKLQGLISSHSLRKRAEEALNAGLIGDQRPLLLNLDAVCQEIG